MRRLASLIVVFWCFISGCLGESHQFASSEKLLFLRQNVYFEESNGSVEDKCEQCPQICNFDSGECACIRGFIKVSDHHCQDVDECSLEKDICGAHGKCINTVGSFVCRCQTGFKPLPSGRCGDIDECALAAKHKPCHQLCTNVPGSYSCSCHQGYALVAGGATGECADVNECLQHESGCSHLCVNTPGSFVCRCPSPLILAEDQRTCGAAGAKRHRKSPALLSKQPVRPFDDHQHFCPFRCLNRGVCRQGACHCPPGLTGVVCQTDVDECAVLPQDSRCEHVCQNTFGSFRCSCQPGYTLAADQRTCEPLACTPSCMGGGVCRRGVCHCPPGLTGPACSIDIDECESSPCQHICRNTLGSFACLCRGRWRLAKDGKSCEEPSCVPHCRNGGTCHQGRCLCQPGYHGRLCQLDVNECSQAESPCPYACVNTVGSYQCLCEAGLRQSPNRTACVLPDPLSDQQQNQEENLKVMIEVVVQDGSHSSFTRYFVNPVVVATKARQSTAYQRSEFPYQPLFEEHREMLHLGNSIVGQFSGHETTRIKTDENQIPSPNILHTPVVYPKVVETRFVASVREIQPEPEEDFFEELDHHLYAEVFLSQTPVLQTEKEARHDETSTAHDSIQLSTISDEIIELTEISHVTTHENENVKNITEGDIPAVVEDLLETTTHLQEDNFKAVTEQITKTPFHPSDNNKEAISTSENLLQTTTLPTESFEEPNTESTTSSENHIISSEEPVQVYTEAVPLKKVTPRIRKKPRRKNKRPKKKKKGALPGDLQVINQILQSFGLESHQGDAKQYEFIDFDDISQKQRASTPRPKKYENLPVFKTAPANVSEERDCYYLSRKIKSRSHFYRDEKNCTKCVCRNGELRCDAHHCPSLRCENPIAGTCCDYCVGDCVIENQVYQNGETFVPELDPCRECRCEDGRAICSDVECPALVCDFKYRAQLPDDCCPSCVAPSAGCFWNQQFFYVGQLWVQRQGGCQACLCRDGGAVQCNPVPCILECLHPHFVAGECCPVCDNCQFQDAKYLNGATFKNPSDPCSSCKCQNGNITCFEETCETNCSHPYKSPGKCCPECSDCLYKNEHISEGASRIFEQENGTCQECSCKLGEMHCQGSECSTGCAIGNGTVVPSGTNFIKPNDHCTTCRCVEGAITDCRNQPCSVDCEHGVLLPGACCVHCHMCDYKGTVYRNMQTFESPSDPCLNCMCALGNVICEENTCLEEDEDYDDEEFEENEE